MPDGQQVAFDPEDFHQQFVSSQGATQFDPDEFHAKYASQAHPDAIAKQSKAAAIAAGVQNPGVSTPPLKPAMEAAGAHEQDRERRLGEAEHRASQSPIPFTKASVLFPAAELPGALASGGLKAVAKGIARGVGKMVGGAAVGSGVGGGVGEIVGHPKEGAEIGATVGGLGAPFAPDAWFSRAPYGINRAILGEEGLADARAASKVAQRNADIKAGLRKAPTPPEPEPPRLMDQPNVTTTHQSTTAIPESALPAIAKGAMLSAGDVTATGAMPATAPGATGPIPESALPAIAKGVSSEPVTSTGAMPARPLGTPEAAAIKKGLGDIATQPRSSGSEGRPATWTNEAVTQLAGKGNREAITQAIRRGLGLPENARYVMGDADFPRAVLNPRETTKFTPEGTPIRNTDNPIAQNPSSRALIQKPEMPAARVEAPPPAEKPPFEAFKPEPEAIARGVQAETTAARAPRAKVQPVAQRYSPDIVGQAEDEMRGALELSDSVPAAGRYFAESVDDQGEFLKNKGLGRAAREAGMTQPGRWYGVKSQKGNIGGAYPWFNDPEISASQLRNAIQQGKGALYERIVGKIAEGITKERSAATASISEHIPELRDLASHVQEIEPELAQTLNDLADGKIALAPDKLKSYVTEKITDATAAAQFAREIDDAAAESRQASVPEARATPNPARPGSGEASPAAQAPELKDQTLGSTVQRKK